MFAHFDLIELPEQIERWQQCERVLVNMPEHEREKHWDMGTFGTKTDCGTVACAAGHCGLDTWFRERGFQLNFAKCTCSNPGCYTQQMGDVSAFFGSTGTNRIFMNEKHRPVEKVAEEVRQYIAELKATIS